MIRRQFLAAIAACFAGAVEVIASAAPAGFRQPIGHTHTCGNGHTWDHTSNPIGPGWQGHTCLQCGRFQNVIDPVPRLVPVPNVAPKRVGHNPLPR